MTWARNIMVLSLAFLLGRDSVLDGWHDFLTQQGVVFVIAVCLVGAWFAIGAIERRVKGKPDALVTVADATGKTTQVPVKFCPKCGVRLAAGAFQHVDTCHGSAA